MAMGMARTCPCRISTSTCARAEGAASSVSALKAASRRRVEVLNSAAIHLAGAEAQNHIPALLVLLWRNRVGLAAFRRADSRVRERLLDRRGGLFHHRGRPQKITVALQLDPQADDRALGRLTADGQDPVLLDPALDRIRARPGIHGP